jgi:hypothetical protein
MARRLTAITRNRTKRRLIKNVGFDTYNRPDLGAFWISTAMGIQPGVGLRAERRHRSRSRDRDRSGSAQIYLKFFSFRYKAFKYFVNDTDVVKPNLSPL